jgi:mRNA interferase MazF
MVAAVRRRRPRLWFEIAHVVTDDPIETLPLPASPVTFENDAGVARGGRKAAADNGRECRARRADLSADDESIAELHGGGCEGKLPSCIPLLHAGCQRRRARRELKRGDIRWYRFSSPDKRRPVLVLGRDSLLRSGSDVPVIPFSTQICGLPWEVVLNPNEGLGVASVLKPEWIRSVAAGGARPAAINVTPPALPTANGNGS